MKLYKQKVSKDYEGKNATFTDFYLGWVFEGKAYAVRVRPCFGCDVAKLYALAEEIPDGEPVEKYL